MDKHILPSRYVNDILKTTKTNPEYKRFKGDINVARHFMAQNVCEWCWVIIDIKTEKGEFRIDDAIDHCHYTEKYRGHLCRRCNLMEGRERRKFPGMETDCGQFHLYIDQILTHKYVGISRDDLIAYIRRPFDDQVPMDIRPDM